MHDSSVRATADALQPSRREQAREALRAWYRPRARAYPWRGASGRRRGPDAYAVLVSEVMLQQTQAGRVVPAFETFMARFPDARRLAAAPLADVLRVWGGLGYPRRAVSLHRAASIVVERHAGVIPSDPAVLRTLPGVGPYTSAAVASMAFGAEVPAVDTNVRRVWARVDHAAEPDEVSPRLVADSAAAWLDLAHPGEWNQALMDLGREVCRPLPRCVSCPLRPWCAFAASGRAGRRSVRRQQPFEGSMRQLRGKTLASLRERSPRTLGGLARELDAPAALVAEAVVGLYRDGVVAASPSALERNDRGRVSLPLC